MGVEDEDLILSPMGWLLETTSGLRREQDMKILITGGSGFIGSYVVEELAEAGHQVRVFDLHPPARPGVAHVAGDLTVLEQVEEAVREMDAICHIGGVGDVYLSFSKPHVAAAINVLGTANVLEAALTHKVRRVVYASTWEVYGKAQYEPVDEEHPCNPDHPYNITKFSGDLLCQSYRELKNLDVLVLRLGTAYGAGMRESAVLPAFILLALKGEPITINGTGEQYRQFTHARDIAQAFRLAMEKNTVHHVFNIVAPERTTILEIAKLVTSHIPTEISTREARVGDVSPAIISSQKAEEELGWRAQVPFAKGAEELIQLYRQRSTRPST